ncbi:MAG: hypothetical protein J5840_00605 [Lachnospiraceae bacterium]|nr:hypothetical protein [Lachnospiraceae bacterium]
MKLRSIKNNLIKGITKAAAAALSLNILLLSACVGLPSGDNGKDDDSQSHAVVSENETGTNDTGNEDVNKPGNDSDGKDDNQTDPDKDTVKEGDPDNTEKPDANDKADIKIQDDGFGIPAKKSFAAKAAGLYRIYSSDGYDKGCLEIYDIGDNLYGFYSGYGYAGLEFFATDSEGFSSEDAESVEVKIVTFDTTTEYWSKGMPAELTMTLTDEGIQFSKYQTESGYLPFDEDATLERTDEEMGLLSGFAYRSDEYDINKELEDANIKTLDKLPEGLAGAWILLGDIESGIIMELTEDGLVQIYLKNLNEPVLLLRGQYAVGSKKINGGYNIYMNLVQFGYGSPDVQKYCLCYTFDENDYMLCLEGDEDFGPDLVWDSAAFVPFDKSNYARKYHDEYSMADKYNEINREYISEDGLMLVLNDDSTFMIYDSEDLSNLEAFVEGRYEENPGGLSLYIFSYEDGSEDYYGAVTFIDARTVQLGIYSTKETITLKPCN